MAKNKKKEKASAIACIVKPKKIEEKEPASLRSLNKLDLSKIVDGVSVIHLIYSAGRREEYACSKCGNIITKGEATCRKCRAYINPNKIIRGIVDTDGNVSYSVNKAFGSDGALNLSEGFSEQFKDHFSGSGNVEKDVGTYPLEEIDQAEQNKGAKCEGTGDSLKGDDEMDKSELKQKVAEIDENIGKIRGEIRVINQQKTADGALDFIIEACKKQLGIKHQELESLKQKKEALEAEIAKKAKVKAKAEAEAKAKAEAGEAKAFEFILKLLGLVASDEEFRMKLTTWMKEND